VQNGGRAGIPSFLHENVQHLAILINRAPEIMAFSMNRDKHFINVPCVSQASLATSQLFGKEGAEFQTPLAHGFVTDAHPTTGQEIFDITKTKTETMVEPYGVGDNLRRKSVATIKGNLRTHTSSLPATSLN
jgi:hypothetical protein